MTRNRGFTLIELMIAGVLSAVVVFGAFLALTGLQRSGARQTEADEVVGRARLAMEIIARDIRSAGDSLDLLATPCLDPADSHPDRTFQCPAILEAHPWRLVLARNGWTDSSGTKPALYRSDDLPPVAGRAFDTWPENVVLYQFVPYVDEPTDFADGRTGYLGRIERVVNPFDFPRGTSPESARVMVLLENVLLDDRMREKPDGTEVDPRYHHALFLFQVLTTKDKFVGDPAITGRESSALDDAFLTPPMRFFPAGPPAALVKESPYAPDHPAQVVGLEKDAKHHANLLATNPQGLKASEHDSDLRLVLDRSLIRTVRIAFKVVGPERTDRTTGLDLDGNPGNGTAAVYAFETTAELKALAQFTMP